MGPWWMPLFEQVWLFIMCYYHCHCFLAQSRDYSDFHCNLVFFFIYSPEKWGEFINEDTKGYFSSVVATHLALSDTMNGTTKPLIYLSGRGRDEFLRHSHFAIILCYIHYPVFFTVVSSVSLEVSILLMHPIDSPVNIRPPANDWAKQD